MDVYGEALRNPPPAWGQARTRAPDARNPTRVRVPGGALPEALTAPLANLAHHAAGFLECLRAISKALKAEMRDKPDEARRPSTLYAQIGMLAPRLEAVYDTTQLLLQDTPLPEEGGRGHRCPAHHPQRQMVHAGGGRRADCPQGPRQLPSCPAPPAAPPSVGRGARRGADLGHAHQLRQL